MPATRRTGHRAELVGHCEALALLRLAGPKGFVLYPRVSPLAADRPARGGLRFPSRRRPDFCWCHVQPVFRGGLWWAPARPCPFACRTPGKAPLDCNLAGTGGANAPLCLSGQSVPRSVAQGIVSPWVGRSCRASGGPAQPVPAAKPREETSKRCADHSPSVSAWGSCAPPQLPAVRTRARIAVWTKLPAGAPLRPGAARAERAPREPWAGAVPTRPRPAAVQVVRVARRRA